MTASQQLGGGHFLWCSGTGKQLGGKKHADLWASGLRHSILGNRCRGQSSTWLGQERLLSDEVQLIWRAHVGPSSVPAELWQSPLLCAMAKGIGSTKGQQVSTCAWDTSSLVHFGALFAQTLSTVPGSLLCPSVSLPSPLRWCGAGRSSLTTLLLPMPPSSCKGGRQGHARVTQPWACQTGLGTHRLLEQHIPHSSTPPHQFSPT